MALWTWAIWTCAENWRGNPNYSYGWAVPILALAFAVRRYSLWQNEGVAPTLPARGAAVGLVAVALMAAGCGFGLEYARVEMWHPGVVLWTICSLAVATTFFVFWRHGGPSLARAEMFPVLFFLTGAPWPPRLETPLTAQLMQWVASATTEILHWLGVEAVSSGGAIALRGGLVGITEACSGIRSLQAGIMFGFAVGEWFLLRPARRVVLLGIAVLLALATNLTRTLILSLQAERHGAASIEEVHDLVGNIMISALIFGLWFAGKLLSRRRREKESSPNDWLTALQQALRNVVAPGPAIFGVTLATLLLGIFSARLVYARAEAQAHTQTAPYFSPRADAPGNQVVPVAREVWNDLRPTSGEAVRHTSTDPAAGGEGFHFFWKPSVWNRFVLVHRPDICMPGIGWQSDGAPEPIDLKFGDQNVRFYLFKFRRGDVHALELWGAWRNGDPVPLEYTPDQVFGAAPPPSSLNLEGKRRSATEIVACMTSMEGREPSREIVVALLYSAFQYKKNE